MLFLKAILSGVRIEEYIFYLLGKERRLLDIDWDELKEEFKVWKIFWTQRAPGTVALAFAMSLSLLALSYFDVGSDSELARSYIEGENYTQFVNDTSNLKFENCTLVKKITCQEKGDAKKSCLLL